MRTKEETIQAIKCATIKLDRALAYGEMGHYPVDPVSGFNAPEIVRYLITCGPVGKIMAKRRDALELADVVTSSPGDSDLV